MCSSVAGLYDHLDCRLFVVVVKLSFLTVDLESYVRDVVGNKWLETSSIYPFRWLHLFDKPPLAVLSSRPERPIVDI